LGLAIVQGIVGTHEDTLTVESHPGQGTTFALHLPQLAPPAADHTPAPAAERMQKASD
jgi:signal transduction histidine kinase